MRIAIVTWNRRRIAGTETYLSKVIPALAGLGHTLGLWHECDEPLNRECIELPDQSERWNVAELGAETALSQLRGWQPDLIYAHGLADPGLEAEVLRIAPTVFFAHNYHGNCISGTKMFKYPFAQPCSRRFGWQCLVHFYPRRCGGLNPLTTLTQYQLQSRRHQNLPRYDAVIVFSEHLQKEYAALGLRTYLAYGDAHKKCVQEAASQLPFDSEREKSKSRATTFRLRPYWQLLFLGRMEFVKGGHVLLNALPLLKGKIDRPMRVVFAGDGPDRLSWERQGEEVRRLSPGLAIEFTGWLSEREVEELLDQTDLLVLPSLWPEPFGLAVIEAGRRGVPVAAFAVGAISGWLTDGLNGYLAHEMPPNAAGLAAAIGNCLSDPIRHLELRRGAIQVAERFQLNDHMQVLEQIFAQVVSNRKLKSEQALSYSSRS